MPRHRSEQRGNGSSHTKRRSSSSSSSSSSGNGKGSDGCVCSGRDARTEQTQPRTPVMGGHDGNGGATASAAAATTSEAHATGASVKKTGRTAMDAVTSSPLQHLLCNGGVGNNRNSNSNRNSNNSGSSGYSNGRGGDNDASDVMPTSFLLQQQQHQTRRLRARLAPMANVVAITLVASLAGCVAGVVPATAAMVVALVLCVCGCVYLFPQRLLATLYAAHARSLYENMLRRSDMLPQPVTDKHTLSGENATLSYGFSCMQGWRRTMEDAHTLLLLDDGGFFGVYDGHSGAGVAQFCGENMYRFVTQTPAWARGCIGDALNDGFIALDRHLYAVDAAVRERSGCTAVVLYVHGDMLYCANAGDSRCVLCRNGVAEALSSDHKPDVPHELARIERAGGFVYARRVNGALALSRAIGDFGFKTNRGLPWDMQAVTSAPQVITRALHRDKDEFAVLACDGIWDRMSNDEVVAFVRLRLQRRMPLTQVAEELMNNCLSSVPFALGCDNMSVVIVQFRRHAASPAPVAVAVATAAASTTGVTTACTRSNGGSDSSGSSSSSSSKADGAEGNTAVDARSTLSPQPPDAAGVEDGKEQRNGDASRSRRCGCGDEPDMGSAAGQRTADTAVALRTRPLGSPALPTPSPPCTNADAASGVCCSSTSSSSRPMGADKTAHDDNAVDAVGDRASDRAAVQRDSGGRTSNNNRVDEEDTQATSSSSPSSSTAAAATTTTTTSSSSSSFEVVDDVGDDRRSRTRRVDKMTSLSALSPATPMYVDDSIANASSTSSSLALGNELRMLQDAVRCRLHMDA